MDNFVVDLMVNCYNILIEGKVLEEIIFILIWLFLYGLVI